MNPEDPLEEPAVPKTADDATDDFLPALGTVADDPPPLGRDGSLFGGGEDVSAIKR
jgi:hypothetical protein